MINVRNFGAVGNGEFDDTGAIQAAAFAARSGAVLRQPAGGSYQGTSDALYFPPGEYKITNRISLGPYQVIHGEDAIIRQVNPLFDSFWSATCYRNRIQGMQFVGGRRQLSFENANVDMTQLVVDGCTFQDWADCAILAESPVGDHHMSATLTIRSCVFDGGQMLRTRCDSTTIQNSRHQFRGEVTAGVSAIQNLYGVMAVDDFTGTPACEQVNGQVHWFDNSGSLRIRDSRLGGEYGGIPCVIDRGGPNVQNPWHGRSVIIEGSQVCAGKNVWPESALLTLAGLPQCIQITGCFGITSNTLPVIKIAPGYDMDGAIQQIDSLAAPSKVMYSICTKGNHWFTPVPIPAMLQQFVI